MVEIFITDVTSKPLAKDIVNAIHKTFAEYSVNFDLEDKDNILRVESAKEICRESLIGFLKNRKITAEVYPEP